MIYWYDISLAFVYVLPTDIIDVSELPTWSAAAIMLLAFSSSNPYPLLTSAAQRFKIPNALIMGSY